MLNKKEQPVAWAMLMYELDDAHEHLGTLVQKMVTCDIDPVDFRIQLRHVFEHLNRAWNGQNDPNYADWSTEKLLEQSQFPPNLETLYFEPKKMSDGPV